VFEKYGKGKNSPVFFSKRNLSEKFPFSRMGQGNVKNPYDYVHFGLMIKFF